MGSRGGATRLSRAAALRGPDPADGPVSELAVDAPRIHYRPRHLFPLIRHLSCRVTPLLVGVPVTPNQVTLASIAIGLAGAACFMQGNILTGLLGALLLVVSYVLDSVDGELARIRETTSRFGDRLAEVGGWLVHATLFIAFGMVAKERTGNALWLIFAYAAAAGATANLVVALLLKGDPVVPASTTDAARTVGPAELWTDVSWKDRAVFVLRELMHQDFCFLVVVLAVVDRAWILLPALAVGAQVYWLAGLYRRAVSFHT